MVKWGVLVGKTFLLTDSWIQGARLAREVLVREFGVKEERIGFGVAPGAWQVKLRDRCTGKILAVVTRIGNDGGVEQDEREKVVA